MQTSEKHRLRSLLSLLAIYAVIALFMSLTNPRELPVGLLFFPLVLVFCALFMTVSFVVSGFREVVTRRNSKQTLLVILLSVAPTIAILLKSMGQLGIKDIILLFVLVVLGGWYVRNIRFQ